MNTKEETIKINFNDRDYFLNQRKVLLVLSYFTKAKIENLNGNNLKNLLEKCALLDEYFLENVNKL